jgi:hypothetical protein
MEVGAMPRKMLEGRLFIGRRKGRPRLRWMEDVVAGLRVMKIKQWMEKTKYREQLRLVVEEAKAVAPRGWGWMEYEIVLHYISLHYIIPLKGSGK